MLFFDSSLIPPRSHTLIDLRPIFLTPKLIQRIETFVRSDERVGYHDVVATIVFYLILGILIGTSLYCLGLHPERISITNKYLVGYDLHLCMDGRI